MLRLAPQQLLFAAGIAALLISLGCASAPQIGVREAYQQKTIQRVAVVPFYTLGSFSLSADQLEHILEGAQQAAVSTLEMNGFEVISPEELMAQLSAAQAADTFHDGVLLRRDLDLYFEAIDAAEEPPLEVQTVAELSRRGVLKVDALLFGQVVYHTRTTCDEDPTEYTTRAVIIGEKSTTSAAPSPCVVSHFQGKLVHLPSGGTMWFNRVYLQTFLDASSSDEALQARQNIAEVVGRTLQGSNGVGHFEPAHKTEETMLGSQ